MNLLQKRLCPSSPTAIWGRIRLPDFVATLLAVAVLFSFTACSKLTENNLEKVHNGMSPAEVKAILGEPTSSDTNNMLGLISGTTFTYHTASSDVKITFVNDKVISTEGEFK